MLRFDRRFSHRDGRPSADLQPLTWNWNKPARKDRQLMRRSGWLTFSAVVLIIAGIMRVIDAIWAFQYHGAVPGNLQGALLGHSLATYGWIWLIIGIILIAAGI